MGYLCLVLSPVTCSLTPVLSGNRGEENCISVSATAHVESSPQSNWWSAKTLQCKLRSLFRIKTTRPSCKAGVEPAISSLGWRRLIHQASRAVVCNDVPPVAVCRPDPAVDSMCCLLSAHGDLRGVPCELEFAGYLSAGLGVCIQ